MIHGHRVRCPPQCSEIWSWLFKSNCERVQNLFDGVSSHGPEWWTWSSSSLAGRLPPKWSSPYTLPRKHTEQGCTTQGHLALLIVKASIISWILGPWQMQSRPLAGNWGLGLWTIVHRVVEENRKRPHAMHPQLAQIRHFRSNFPFKVFEVT